MKIDEGSAKQVDRFAQDDNRVVGRMTRIVEVDERAAAGGRVTGKPEAEAYGVSAGWGVGRLVGRVRATPIIQRMLRKRPTGMK